MLKLKDHNAILRERRKGLSIRAIARRLHYCRETITKVVNDPIPKRYARKKGTGVSVVDQYREVILERIHRATDDLGVCSITGAEIFRFLRDSHGYKGCDTQVHKYLRAKKLLNKKFKTTINSCKNSCKKNISLDVLTTLCLTSAGSARSIL